MKWSNSKGREGKREVDRARNRLGLVRMSERERDLDMRKGRVREKRTRSEMDVRKGNRLEQRRMKDEIGYDQSSVSMSPSSILSLSPILAKRERKYSESGQKTVRNRENLGEWRK